MSFNLYKKNLSSPRAGSVIVSFFSGGSYYVDKARDLAESLDRLELNYAIYEFTPDVTVDWGRVCSQKIRFYRHVESDLDCPFVWVDVDTDILKRPRFVDLVGPDFGAFLRNFKYLNAFDVAMFSRHFHPGYLYFGNTIQSKALIRTMNSILDRCDELGKRVTDDYVLEEAIMSVGHVNLTITLFNPDELFSEDGDVRTIDHGDSGNVSNHRGRVLQHEKHAMDPGRLCVTYSLAAKKLVASGRTSEALCLLGLAHEVKPRDPDIYVRLLRLARAQDDIDRVEELLVFGQRCEELRVHAFLFNYERHAKSSNWPKAMDVMKLAKAIGGGQATSLLRSRHERYSLNQRAEHARVKITARPKIWWWERPFPGNLGDIINPYIVEELTGVPPIWKGTPGRTLCAGSIIPFAKEGDTIWGSGTPRDEFELSNGIDFKCVRGPLTRDVLLAKGVIDCPEVYGDPALLLPLIYKPRRRIFSRFSKKRIGLVRHHNHNFSEFNVDSSDILDIEISRCGHDEIREFINEIVSVDLVLSTSLHGIIIAHAYGVPAVYLDMKDAERSVPGTGMKFNDYFLSVGLDYQEPIQVSSAVRIDRSFASLCSATLPPKIDVNPLISSCPFSLNL